MVLWYVKEWWEGAEISGINRYDFSFLSRNRGGGTDLHTVTAL